MVSVDVADPPDGGVTGVGLSVAVIPGGAVVANPTALLNPLSDFTVIVEVPDPPRLIVKEDGDADIEKSGVTGAGTVTITVVEWLNESLVPCTVTVYVPCTVPLGTVIKSVDDALPPDASESEVGLRETIQLAG